MVDIHSWGWPQFAYVAMCLIGIGVCMVRHGKTEFKTQNFWSDIFYSLPAWSLLILGGFFA